MMGHNLLSISHTGVWHVWSGIAMEVVPTLATCPQWHAATLLVKDELLDAPPLVHAPRLE